MSLLCSLDLRSFCSLQMRRRIQTASFPSQDCVTDLCVAGLQNPAVTSQRVKLTL